MIRERYYLTTGDERKGGFTLEAHGLWERLCELFNYCPASRRIREARSYARYYGLTSDDLIRANLRELL